MDEKYMMIAYDQAKKAYKNNDIPVGAVIIKNGIIISRGYNKREKTKNAINHAEIIAIKKACNKINDWRLTGCTLYVTLEPCEMCLGAAMQARINKIIYATKNTQLGNRVDLKKLQKLKNLKIEEKCSTIIKDFFKTKRK